MVNVHAQTTMCQAQKILLGTAQGRCITNEPKSEGTPCVKLTLNAFNIGQKVDDVSICVVLLGSNATCKNEVQHVKHSSLKRLTESLCMQPMCQNVQLIKPPAKKPDWSGIEIKQKTAHF